MLKIFTSLPEGKKVIILSTRVTLQIEVQKSCPRFFQDEVFLSGLVFLSPNFLSQHFFSEEKKFPEFSVSRKKNV